MAHPNVEVLRRLDEAMLKEDMETFFAQYTNDVVVHIPGKSKLAGTYKGLDKLQDLFGRFMEAAGEYTFENHSYLADDEHGVILQHGTMTKGAKTLNLIETFVSHFRGGKVSEFWYQCDDQAALDAWIGAK
ncbi:MAG: nuclear transport factor 2 family protein [Actinomycetota bacterium]